MTMRRISTLVAFLMLGACRQDAVAPPVKVDTAAETSSIRALEDRQIAAINAKDAAGASGVYAKDAVFIGDNGEMTSGGAAIDASFKKFLSDPSMKIDYQPGAKTFSADGGMAYSTASFTETYTDPKTGKPVTVKGTNLSVWRKQPDGAWKLVADSNPAGASG
jgi:uncharacterized protein (TIGR02246 family)